MPGVPGVPPVNVMKVTPPPLVGPSAAMHRTSGQSGEGLNCELAITESAPIPLKFWAAVPPLSRMHTSPAATLGTPLPLTSRTTTLIRALFGRLEPPSLFGHIRNKRIAAVPSVRAIGASIEKLPAGAPAGSGSPAWGT